MDTTVATIIIVVLILSPLAVVGLVAGFIGYLIGRRTEPTLCRSCGDPDGSYRVCQSCLFDRAIRERPSPCPEPQCSEPHSEPQTRLLRQLTPFGLDQIEEEAGAAWAELARMRADLTRELSASIGVEIDADTKNKSK